MESRSRPLYISTVDSGNLVASLLALVAGCREAVGAPLLAATARCARRRAWAAAREHRRSPTRRTRTAPSTPLASALAHARAAPPCCLPAWRCCWIASFRWSKKRPRRAAHPEPAAPSRRSAVGGRQDEAPYWAGLCSAAAGAPSSTSCAVGCEASRADLARDSGTRLTDRSLADDGLPARCRAARRQSRWPH